jgi:hypothetical protein
MAGSMQLPFQSVWRGDEIENHDLGGKFLPRAALVCRV